MELIQLNQDYRFEKESPTVELGYFFLKSIYHLKAWEFDQSEEITKNYLNSFIKLTDKKKVPIYLMGYFYLHEGVKNNLYGKYQNSIKSFQQYLNLNHKNEQINLIIETSIVINYICICYYEQAIQLINSLLEKITKFPEKQQEQKVKLLYLKGFTYFYIGFYKNALDNLQQTLAAIKVYPEMENEYLLTTQYRLISVLHEMNLIDEKKRYLMEIYQAIMRKKKSNRAFLKNELLPISELFVIFSEEGDITRAIELLSILNGIEFKTQEMNYFIDYGLALCYLHKGDVEQYERAILLLLKKVGQSNDPTFIAKVKKQASSYFANQQKYKKSYEILKEEQ
ncbi:helix-turn-helix domain-containing protein [Carnobacterium gallinarum]|uniref:hypothetical protein n=1 Tax=Carnobacterium gallinarum TaxID=2749 RepID=UPI00068989AE|nr:hypothetical protein [Carnobacterium gallinarum]